MASVATGKEPTTLSALRLPHPPWAGGRLCGPGGWGEVRGRADGRKDTADREPLSTGRVNLAPLHGFWCRNRCHRLVAALSIVKTVCVQQNFSNAVLSARVEEDVADINDLELNSGCAACTAFASVLNNNLRIIKEEINALKSAYCRHQTGPLEGLPTATSNTIGLFYYASDADKLYYCVTATEWVRVRHIAA